MFLHPRIFSILYSHSFQTRSRILIVVSCIFYMELFGIQTILPASVGRSFSPILAYDEGTKFRCLKLKTRMIGHLNWLCMNPYGSNPIYHVIVHWSNQTNQLEVSHLALFHSQVSICANHLLWLLIPYLFAMDLGECTSIFTANDHGACFWKILT